MLMFFLALGAQVVLPIVLIVAHGWVRSASASALWLRVAALALMCWLLALVGFWALPPWYTPYFFAALAALASLIAWRRWQNRPAPASRMRRHVEIGLAAVLALLFGLQISAALGGRQLPVGTVDIAFPLGDTGHRYLVVNGGHHPMINAHFMTLDNPDFADYRGQSFAVDIIAIDGRGSRAERFLGGSDPAEYLIFGAPVLAPCDGAVIGAEGAMPDLPVPERDTERLEGNHLLIDCGNFIVLMAHLRQGSLSVGVGDMVRARQPLAEVGNSGQSGEPHLHVHAQRGTGTEAPLSGEPLPISFDGVFPVRNARLQAP
ncbi:MAG: M23 family metallopeptidase [Pararhodobacter sp.]|nr:M23 family metallopeptidase [Pararhodobacter sp.]